MTMMGIFLEQTLGTPPPPPSLFQERPQCDDGGGDGDDCDYITWHVQEDNGGHVDHPIAGTRPHHHSGTRYPDHHHDYDDHEDDDDDYDGDDDKDDGTRPHHHNGTCYPAHDHDKISILKIMAKFAIFACNRNQGVFLIFIFT